jgi:hypothetical protein
MRALRSAIATEPPRLAHAVEGHISLPKYRPPPRDAKTSMNTWPTFEQTAANDCFEAIAHFDRCCATGG